MSVGNRWRHVAAAAAAALMGLVGVVRGECMRTPLRSATLPRARIKGFEIVAMIVGCR